jgi:hypothetical protein
VLASQQQPGPPRPEQQQTPQPKPSVPPQPGVQPGFSQQSPPAPVSPQPNQSHSQQQAKSPQPKKRAKKCPHCGAALRSNVRFCGSCGAQIGIDASQPSGGRGRFWLIALLVVLVVAAGISAFYLIYFNPLGMIGGRETPSVEAAPVEVEPVIEDTPTPTITMTETTELPTETPEPDTPTPTETPVPTDTPTMTPAPTLTFTPLPPLIDEPFIEPLDDRWWLTLFQPELNPDSKYIKLNGFSLNDHITNKKPFELKQGIVIKFKVSVSGNNNLGFRWDPTPNLELPPYENAPLSLRFAQDNLNIRYAISKNEFTECRISIRGYEPNDVSIEIHDGRTVIMLNNQTIPDCSSVFSQALYAGPNPFGAITFSGNGLLYELKVFTNP